MEEWVEGSGFLVARLVREGVVDGVERAVRVYGRVRSWEGRVRGFLSLMGVDGFLGVVRAGLERGGPLSGLIVAVKDNILVEGFPATAGSRMLEGYRPGFTATSARRVVLAGGAVIGKTNLDEFAMGSTTELSAYGPTRNPLCLDRVPGGSSGGSAAVLAYGGADLALGSDTGGSVRLPAAYTGTVALKPTYGAVSRYGLIPYANSLEQVSPMARRVIDVALLFEVISGYDPRDSTTLHYRWEGLAERLARQGPIDAGSLKLCVPEELLAAADRTVAKVVEDLLSKLDWQGANIERVRVPILRHALPAYYTIAFAEAASNLARYDGSYTPCRAREARSWEELVVETRSKCFGPEVKRRIFMGSYVLSVGYRDMYYIAATRLRRRIRDEMLRLTRDCLVVTPASPVLPPRLGERLSDPLKLYALDVMTVTANLAGVPALALPAGRAEGLPVGVQLMGAPLSEEHLLRAGLLLELEAGAYMKVPVEG